MNYIKKSFIILILLVIVGACKDDPPAPRSNWNLIGLDGKTVYQLKVFENWIYAGTDQGILRKNMSLSSSQWEELGFRGKNVRAFYLRNKNSILVSIVDDLVPENSELYNTTNAGNSWTLLPNGFGEVTNEKVIGFCGVPNVDNSVYAIGDGVIAVSEDFGSTWTKKWGEWQAVAGGGLSFVKVNPENANEIWAGGQNAIEEGILLHTINDGTDWTESNDLMPSPSTAKSIYINQSIVLTGWEGGILKSLNSGTSWSQSLDTSNDNRFIYAILNDPLIPNNLYAVGWLKVLDQPQDLILFESTDNGNSWKETVAPNEGSLFGGAFDMVMLQDAFAKKLYIGLYKGGVYEYTLPL